MSLMPPRLQPPPPPPGGITPAETARYTAELLESLRKIAIRQEQVLLAHFLELAVVEAKSQANLQAQATRLPE
jgi:hypothetical protein